MVIDYLDDANDDNRDTTVAWQAEYEGVWSKTHETDDKGQTTLCGVTVPEAVTTDSTGPMGRCKRCSKLRKGTQ